MENVIADIFIILCGACIAVALVAAVFSVSRSLRINKRRKDENRVPVRIIELCTVIGVLAIGLPVLLFMSLTDMCIIMVIVLLCVAAGAVAFSKFMTMKLRKRV